MSTQKNIRMLETIAEALGELLSDVVFVGGATTSLYLDDPAAPVPTPTDDVDCVVQIGSKAEYDEFEAKLRKKGFKDPDLEDGAPICRKIYKGIDVDVMPTDERILGFSNQWYSEGIENKVTFQLPSKTRISIFSIPYFLATKLVAYNDRGRAEDPRVSQDLEDICAVLDGSSRVEEEIQNSPPQVQKFIRSELKELLLDEELFEEAAHGFIRASGDPVGRAKRVVKVARAVAFP